MDMYADGLFDGQVGFVTGAGRGIGKAIALTLAELGADVGVNDLHEDLADQTANEIRALGQSAISVSGDVTDYQRAEAMIDEVSDELGTVVIVVNNAGSNSDDLLIDLPIGEWEKVMQVNTTANLVIGRKAAQKMIKNDVVGSIVNVSSITGTMVQPGAGAYSTSKAATIMLTRQMALEWAEHGIRVNAICPGLIWTPATDSVYSNDALFEERRQWVPLQKIGHPEDVARSVVYLLAPQNHYTTGEALFVDGGARCVGLNMIPGRAQHE